MTKVARGHVLRFFNEIFDGLCKLYSDVDLDVKSGAQLLDRLMKDVVTESEHVDLGSFIPLLGERIKIRNPFIRQLLVGWITVLDSVPDLDMLEHLPVVLGGLFDMLSDPNRDIRQQSYSALSELLREITQAVQQTASNTIPGSTTLPANSSNIDLAAMIVILVHTCAECRDNFTRLCVLTWINEFLVIGSPTTLLPFVADMLGVALQCISDAEKEIRAKSELTNEMLLSLVSSTGEPLNLVPLLAQLTTQLQNKWVPSRLASLRWISMLLSKLPGQLQSHLELDLFPVLLRTLQDQDDLVVKLDIEVLARICLDQHSHIDEKNFTLVLQYLLGLFKSDRKFLEIRGSFIIRSLCELLDAEAIYRKWSAMLAGDASNTESGSTTATAVGEEPVSVSDSEDYEFNSLMVQTLNLILLTSVELAPLRTRLKHCLQQPAGSAAAADDEGLSLFQSLYRSWVHNPIATFSLCLLTQTYFLSSELILRIAQVDITVNYLMQIDKLIQLLESPIFIHLRLRLLEEPSEKNNILYLLKSLYGVLMLLPQSSAFTSLKTRLESVAPLVLLMKGVHEIKLDGGAAAAAPATLTPSNISVSLESSLPISALLLRFEAVQAKHSAKKQRAQKSASLIKKEAATPAATS